MIVAGPSGAGKSTLIKALTKKYPDSFGFSVSHTTRSARPNEQHGKDYFFVNNEEFQQMIDDREFVEWFKVHDKMKGTAKS